MGFFKVLIRTDSHLSGFIIRCGLAIVIFGHGAQKLFGWFGGHGPAETIEMWQHWWNMPVALTILVILGESLGSIALALGFIGRFMAAAIGVIMLGAIYLVHWQEGFFMNWYAQPNRGEGFEYHILALAMVFMILIKGSGKWSIDASLTKRFNCRVV